MRSEADKKALRPYAQRVALARMRLLAGNGFYGVLLMHVKFALSADVERARVSGDTIEFSPAFLDQITDKELEYVLMHEVLHVALRHEKRCAFYENELFDKACDIVVNSIILESCRERSRSISLECAGGVQPHTAPNGREGREFSAEELYDLLSRGGTARPGQQGEAGAEGKKAARSSGAGGSRASRDRRGGSGFGKVDGWDVHVGKQRSGAESGDGAKQGDGVSSGNVGEDAVWASRIIDACDVVMRQERGSENRGGVPGFAQRMFDELRHPQTDWRAILADFVQEEICDYSFSPPDRRFGDSPFFLPDFNETQDEARDILFMIDTSGSMSDTAITAVYSEVKGAIDQFEGHLSGWLGFFDAAVIEPKPFESEEEFKVIKPTGGGGTSFEAVFEYVRSRMADREIASIVILTDGYASFPAEDAACGIPVLWLIVNDKVEPPWGKTTRIKM